MPNASPEIRAWKKREENKAVQRSRFLPVVMRQAIVEENYPAARAAIKKAIEREESWALIAWMKAAEVIAPDKLVVMLQSFGVRDEREMQGLIESGRRLEGLADMSIEAQYEAAEEVLKMCVARQPELRPRVVKLAQSYAEEVEG